MAPALLDADWRRELIASLAEEDPFCPEPPTEAAEAWTEARIRAFFQAGGADACAAAAPAEVAQVRLRVARSTPRPRRPLRRRCSRASRGGSARRA
jgi:hypothetical protein